MNTRQTRVIVAVAFCTIFMSGCIWAPEFDRIRDELQEQTGAEFDKEVTISLGPIAILLARTVVKFVPEAYEAHDYLKEIRRVKVGVYEVDRMPRDAEISMPSKLEKLLTKDWEKAVTVRERDEHVWVLYKEKGDTVREVYVVIMSRKELVMVRASGNVNRILAKAMENDLDWREDLGVDFH